MYSIDREYGGTDAVHECCVWRCRPARFVQRLAPEHHHDNTDAFEPFRVDQGYRIRELTIDMCTAAAAFNLRMAGEEFDRHSERPGLFRIHDRGSINWVRGACAHISYADLLAHNLTAPEVTVFQSLVYRCNKHLSFFTRWSAFAKLVCHEEPISLIGKTFKKRFIGYGWHDGTVVGYNAETGDWLCRYDDNDEEYLRDEELYKLGVEPVKKNGSEECVGEDIHKALERFEGGIESALANYERKVFGDQRNCDIDLRCIASSGASFVDRKGNLRDTWFRQDSEARISSGGNIDIVMDISADLDSPAVQKADVRFPAPWETDVFLEFWNHEATRGRAVSLQGKHKYRMYNLRSMLEFVVRDEYQELKKLSQELRLAEHPRVALEKLQVYEAIDCGTSWQVLCDLIMANRAEGKGLEKDETNKREGQEAQELVMWGKLLPAPILTRETARLSKRDFALFGEEASPAKLLFPPSFCSCLLFPSPFSFAFPARCRSRRRMRWIQSWMVQSPRRATGYRSTCSK